jgi:hypothetical protein
MRQFLTPEEYLKLTNDLKDMVDQKTAPVTTYQYAFATAYDGHIQGKPLLRIYSEFLMLYPQADIKDLHSFCLGYGTAGSVLDALVNEEENDKKQYH